MIFILLIVISLLLFCGLFLYINNKYSYWKRKGVLYLKPIFPFGNAPYTLSKGIAHGLQISKYYSQLKKIGAKIGGVYFGLKPVLIIVDPLYAEDVLKNDFLHFTDRGIYTSENCPITVNILTQKGDIWRKIRRKCSSLFSNTKIKLMCKQLVPYCLYLESHLEKYANKYVCLPDIIGSLNVNFVGSLLFGEEIDCFVNKNHPLKVLGTAMFEVFTLKERINMHIGNYFPAIGHLFGISNMHSDALQFLKVFIQNIKEYRKVNNIIKNDIVQMLTEIENESDVSLDELASQTFAFFGASFETTTTTTSFLLFELANQPKAQERVRNEIKHISAKYNDNITYETLLEMKLLDQAYNETLRRYPVVTNLTRTCVKDYTLKGTDISIPKGMLVLMPNFGYQTDPSYYPDPLTWKLDRFKDNNGKNIGFLPFGDGPRNCVGKMLGGIQVKMAAISILKNYRLSPKPNIKIPLEFDDACFTTRSTEKIYVKLHKD